jgi:hypothetical protein
MSLVVVSSINVCVRSVFSVRYRLNMCYWQNLRAVRVVVKWLMARLLRRRTGFDPNPVRVIFVTDVMAAV